MGRFGGADPPFAWKRAKSLVFSANSETGHPAGRAFRQAGNGSSGPGAPL